MQLIGVNIIYMSIENLIILIPPLSSRVVQEILKTHIFPDYREHT